MDNQDLIKSVDELRALPKETEWVEFKSGNATANDKFGQYSMSKITSLPQEMKLMIS